MSRLRLLPARLAREVPRVPWDTLVRRDLREKGGPEDLKDPSVIRVPQDLKDRRAPRAMTARQVSMETMVIRGLLVLRVRRDARDVKVCEAQRVLSERTDHLGRPERTVKWDPRAQAHTVLVLEGRRDHLAPRAPTESTGLRVLAAPRARPASKE